MEKSTNTSESSDIPEFICVLDRSLSMYGREKTIIQSFNRWLEEQQKNSEEALVTVTLCNEKCELLYSRMPIQYIKKMDSFSYYVKGHTAYLDAVDEVLSLICRFQSESRTNRSQVLFFMVTDGLDNSSTRVKKKELEERIEVFCDRGWEVLFGGKDIASEFREASDMFLEMRKHKTNLQNYLLR